MPHVMVVSSSPDDGPAYLVRVYAYYNVGRFEADVLEWAPASYADADAGIITNSVSGERRSHSRMGEQSAEDGYVRLILTSSPAMLVAVDPVNGFYAWRYFRYEVPLEKMVIPVRFQLWKWQEPYTDAEWTIASRAAETDDDDE